MKTAIYTSRDFLKHDTGAGHPDSPERLQVLHDLFEKEFSHLPMIEPRMAEIEKIALAHDEDYIYALQDKVPEDGLIALDADTILSPQSWKAIVSGAGAGCHAIDDMMSGNITRAFCAVRPAGHHAEKTKAMGFCFFANAFIAARYVQEKYDIKKIAIIDFDVHHGNGTDSLVRAYNVTNPDLPMFFASTHQSELWPNTGLSVDDTNHVKNLTLPAGTSSDEFRQAYRDKILPALATYQPELIIVSAGFDAHKDDPLAGLALEIEDFGWLTREICQMADKYSQKRILSILEGGYDIQALQSSVAAHLRELSVR